MPSSTTKQTSRLLALPDEILSTILANVTKPTKPEFTREPDGGVWPNDETETTVALLEEVCTTFSRLACAEHFSRNVHRVVLRMKYFVFAPYDVAKAPVKFAVLDEASRGNTFAESEFFLDNIRHLVVDVPVSGPDEIIAATSKIRQIVMWCASITSLTVSLDRINDQCLLAVNLELHEIIEAASRRRGVEVRLLIEGTPIVHATSAAARGV